MNNFWMYDDKFVINIDNIVEVDRSGSGTELELTVVDVHGETGLFRGHAALAFWKYLEELSYVQRAPSTLKENDEDTGS